MYQGWKVALAGFFINLVAGIIYTWSIIATNLHHNLGWTYLEATMPYTAFVLFYPPAMILAGRLQDIVGPRRMVIAGGVILSAATMASSFAINPAGMVILWGLVWGIGVACCFASLTPAAIKWFEPEKKGLITGIVVFGMGFSAFITAPLIHYMITAYSVALTLQIAAVILLFGILIPARYIDNPPIALSRENNRDLPAPDIRIRDIFRYPQFYMLWFMFCFIAGTGLTFVNHLDTISRAYFSFERGFLVVSVFAFFNAWGRIIAGLVSDRIGRKNAMTLFYSFMFLTLIWIVFMRTPLVLFVAVAIIGLSYGSIFSLFPASVSAFFGEKNFGLFYGLIFSSMTVGAIFPLFTGYLYEQRGDFTISFLVLSGFCMLTVVLSLLIKNPAKN